MGRTQPVITADDDPELKRGCKFLHYVTLESAGSVEGSPSEGGNKHSHKRNGDGCGNPK